MASKWSVNSQAMIISAAGVLASAILSGFIGYFSSYYSNADLDKLQRARAAQVEIITNFSKSSESLLLEISKYITTVANKKDAKEIQQSLSSELTKQFNDAENLRKYFTSNQITDSVEKYQEALSNFKAETRATSKAEDMPSWVSGFDKVYNARIVLSDRLIGAVDVPLKQTAPSLEKPSDKRQPL